MTRSLILATALAFGVAVRAEAAQVEVFKGNAYVVMETCMMLNKGIGYAILQSARLILWPIGEAKAQMWPYPNGTGGAGGGGTETQSCSPL